MVVTSGSRPKERALRDKPLFPLKGGWTNPQRQGEELSHPEGVELLLLHIKKSQLERPHLSTGLGKPSDSPMGRKWVERGNSGYLSLWCPSDLAPDEQKRIDGWMAENLTLVI